MNGFQSEHYRDYMRHYTGGRLQEALLALQAAANTVASTTESDRAQLGALTFRQGILLYRLSEADAAADAFARAERLMDKVSFAVEMAAFHARFGDNPKEAMHHAEVAIQLLLDKERLAILDDGDRYYRRLVHEIQTKQGRL